MPKPHIRCSSLDRVIGCPGSRTLGARIEADSFDTGEVAGSSVTWRGSWCHWEIARRLIESHGAIAPEEGLGNPDVPKDWQPTQWDYRTVGWHVSTFLEVTPKDHVIYVERHLKLDADSFLLTGHIDVFSVSPDGEEVHWNDHKTGLDEVDEADVNWQIGGYGAIIKAALPGVKRGTARILQRTASRPVSEVEIDDMDRIVPFITKKIEAALANIYQLETGHHCNYCPALAVCGTKFAMRQEIERMKRLLTEHEVARLETVPALKELATVVRACRALGTPIKKLDDALRERLATHNGDVLLDSGHIVRLVEENGQRKVTHPKAAMDFVSDRLGEDVLWGCVEVSLGAIEDALVDTGMKRTSKKEESAVGIIKSMSHLYEQAKVKKLKFIAQ